MRIISRLHPNFHLPCSHIFQKSVPKSFFISQEKQLNTRIHLNFPYHHLWETQRKKIPLRFKHKYTLWKPSNFLFPPFSAFFYYHAFLLLFEDPKYPYKYFFLFIFNYLSFLFRAHRRMFVLLSKQGNNHNWFSMFSMQKFSSHMF